MKYPITIILLLLSSAIVSAQTFDESKLFNATQMNFLNGLINITKTQTNQNIEIHTIATGPKTGIIVFSYEKNNLRIHDNTITNLSISDIPNYEQIKSDPLRTLQTAIATYNIKYKEETTIPKPKPTTTTVTTSTLPKRECPINQKKINGQCCEDNNNNNICDYKDRNPCLPPHTWIGYSCCLDSNNDKICETEPALAPNETRQITPTTIMSSTTIPTSNIITTTTLPNIPTTSLIQPTTTITAANIPIDTPTTISKRIKPLDETTTTTIKSNEYVQLAYENIYYIIGGIIALILIIIWIAGGDE